MSTLRFQGFTLLVLATAHSVAQAEWTPSYVSKELGGYTLSVDSRGPIRLKSDGAKGIRTLTVYARPQTMGSISYQAIHRVYALDCEREQVNLRRERYFTGKDDTVEPVLQTDRFDRWEKVDKDGDAAHVFRSFCRTATGTPAAGAS